MDDVRSWASGALTRRLTAAACVLAAGLALGGCTTPEPESVTPTPTNYEQLAVEAVQRYLDVWSEISQDPSNADKNRIYQVAADYVATDAIGFWSDCSAKEWHLVGGPSIISVDSVQEGISDGRGRRFHVHTCTDITGSYLVDASGNQVGRRGEDRKPTNYTVLVTQFNQFLVIEDRSEEGTC